MTDENHNLEETEAHDVAEENDLALSSQLLRFHDDLNRMLSDQEFYAEAISALVHGEDCDVLYTQRQQSGMARMGKRICENGSELSNRLGDIRTQVGDIKKQLG